MPLNLTNFWERFDLKWHTLKMILVIFCTTTKSTLMCSLICSLVHLFLSSSLLCPHFFRLFFSWYIISVSHMSNSILFSIIYTNIFHWFPFGVCTRLVYNFIIVVPKITHSVMNLNWFVFIPSFLSTIQCDFTTKYILIRVFETP